jgi:hypothetical protein
MPLPYRIKRLWAKVARPGSLGMLYHGLTVAPRLLLHLASLAALSGLFAACVPATRYEEAKSASEVELAGRKRAETELTRIRAELDSAHAELDQRTQKLAETEQSVSESKLESSVAVKQRDEATGLVEQLRGDLARVGDNLRSYAQQKAELEKSLQAAEARKLELERNEAHTVAIARLTRDLTSALGDRMTSGEVLIDVRDGHVVLSAAPELWFNDDRTLRAGMNGVLSAVSRVLALHADSALELNLPSLDADQRGPALVQALGSRGVDPSRVKLSAVAIAPGPSALPTPAKAASVVELSFSVG